MHVAVVVVFGNDFGGKLAPVSEGDFIQFDWKWDWFYDFIFVVQSVPKVSKIGSNSLKLVKAGKD